MSLITEIEAAVLERLSESLVTADVWTAQGDQVRQAVNDALDELLGLGLFARIQFQVPLAANTSVYRFCPNDTVIGVLGAELLSENRGLLHKALTWIATQDPKFLLTRGSPWAYTVMDFSKFMVYPTPDASGDTVEFDAFILPGQYVTGDHVSDLSGDLWEAAISLAVANIQMRIPAGLPQAIANFQMFVERIPWADEFRRSWNSYYHSTMKGLGD